MKLTLNTRIRRVPWGKSGMLGYLKALLTILLFSHFVFACSRENPTAPVATASLNLEIRMDGAKRSSAAIPNNQEGDIVDIFVFSDDALRQLETYQRCPVSLTMSAASTPGRKTVVAIRDVDRSMEDWAGISSYAGLAAAKKDLSAETQKYPTLSGECRIDAGTETVCPIKMRPLTVKLTLGAIRTDFAGKTYYGEKISDMKAYLINVNGRASLLDTLGERPSSILNNGALSREDVCEMRDTSMLVQKIDFAAEALWHQAEAQFLCYPNTAEEDSPGTPFTRLVIEGTLLGEKRYWPIDINRGDFLEEGSIPGIQRGRNYVLDVTIKTRGSDSPDIPVSAKDVSLKCIIEPWKVENEDIESY